MIRRELLPLAKQAFGKQPVIPMHIQKLEMHIAGFRVAQPLGQTWQP